MRQSACLVLKVGKGAKIRNRYKQVPHLTQDTNGKVTNSQLDTTNESQEVSPFPAGDHKAHIYRLAQRHSKHKTEQKHNLNPITVSSYGFLFNCMTVGQASDSITDLTRSFNRWVGA